MNSPSSNHPHFHELTTEVGILKETSVDDVISEIDSTPDLDGLSERDVDTSSGSNNIEGDNTPSPDEDYKDHISDQAAVEGYEFGAADLEKTDKTPSLLLSSDLDGLSERDVDDPSKEDDEFLDCLPAQTFEDKPMVKSKPDTYISEEEVIEVIKIEDERKEVNEGQTQPFELLEVEQDATTSADVEMNASSQEQDTEKVDDIFITEASDEIEEKLDKTPITRTSESGDDNASEVSVTTLEGSVATTEGSEITTVTSLENRLDSTSQGTRSDSPFARPYSSLSLQSVELLSSLSHDKEYQALEADDDLSSLDLDLKRSSAESSSSSSPTTQTDSSRSFKSDKPLEVADDPSSLDLQLKISSAEFSSSSSTTTQGDSSRSPTSVKSPDLSSISLADSLDLILGGIMKIPGDPNAILRQKYQDQQLASRPLNYVEPIKFNTQMSDSISSPTGQSLSSTRSQVLVDELWEEDEISPEVRNILTCAVSASDIERDTSDSQSSSDPGVDVNITSFDVNDFNDDIDLTNFEVNEETKPSSDARSEISSEDSWFDADSSLSDTSEIPRGFGSFSRASDGSLSSSDTSRYSSAKLRSLSGMNSDESETDDDLSPRLGEKSAELIGICNLLAEKIGEMLEDRSEDKFETPTSGKSLLISVSFNW